MQVILAVSIRHTRVTYRMSQAALDNQVALRSVALALPEASAPTVKMLFKAQSAIEIFRSEFLANQVRLGRVCNPCTGETWVKVSRVHSACVV